MGLKLASSMIGAGGHGQSFQYTLNPKGEKSVDLVVTYWGGDTGRTFDVFANDTLLATEELKAQRPGEFFEKRYSIPVEVLAAAKDGQVKIKFVAKVWLAGGVYDVRLMRTLVPTTPSLRQIAPDSTGAVK